MFTRYMKSQLIVLLFGGLVGPIFLIVYFALRPTAGPYIQWMLFVGLFITAADVLIALALTNYSAKSAANTAALERGGVLALAQITGIGETNVYINNQPMISLNLIIEGPGIAPFDATDRVRASVTRMGNFSQRKLVVLVDPATHKFRIDWERSALINGLVPAQFTVAEDNKTYDLSGQAGPLMEILQILKANNVPLNQMVDLRSNPALRQQVLTVIRRAAGPQPQASASAGPPPAAPAAAPAPTAPPPPYSFTPPAPSVAQRLQELETLRATGAVNEQEYKAKRSQIISEI